MSQPACELREYELTKGECLLIQYITGECFVIAIRDIGHDIHGEPVVELAIHTSPDDAYEILNPEDEHARLWHRTKSELEVSVDGENRSKCGVPSCRGFPRLWLLLGYLLSHRVRQEFYLPMFNECLEDYSFTRLKIRRRRDRNILTAIYTCRTVAMVMQSLMYAARTTRLPCRTIAGFMLAIEFIRRFTR